MLGAGMRGKHHEEGVAAIVEKCEPKFSGQ
jgi:hypothetical protein